METFVLTWFSRKLAIRKIYQIWKICFAVDQCNRFCCYIFLPLNDVRKWSKISPENITRELLWFTLFCLPKSYNKQTVTLALKVKKKERDKTKWVKLTSMCTEVGNEFRNKPNYSQKKLNSCWLHLNTKAKAA